MPDAKDNMKQTGDTRLPEVESDFDAQEGSTDAVGTEGTPSNRGRAAELGQEGKPGRGINQAGFIKDRDAPTSDSYGNTRDSGET
ncbi:hypothetical protein FN976_22190 [Caenimonas sedimenti]|uniref:Uncharacterized protein n=1 Tax=Caenimonas sedimenti TaxID=2596921 RepID=A0A562ZJZ2_9BURK|nr:hypothetical protein [Caenimonas sedimenti]TWO68707.1 hypothetical protein FN976_22190 [Caenimonas sedimenti]